MRLLALIGLALVLAVAPAAFAHGGGEAMLYVPLDHVVQGEKFPVVGADLDPRSTVTVRLGDTRLGTVKTDAEGHFKTLVAAPAGFPDGYAELKAASEDGEAVSTFVRVGAGPPPVQAPAPAAASDGFPALAAVLIGLSIAAALLGGYLLGRARS